MSMDVLRANPHAAQSATQRAAWLPLLAIFAFAVLLRNILMANTDVSWLITLCEKMLAGERPYVDFIETNPPAAILLYFVPVALARAVSLRPEIMVDAFVFISVGLSLWLSAAILRAAQRFDESAIAQLAVLFAAIFLVLPAQTFGEREHIAAILFLPLLALSAVRASGTQVSLFFAIAVGLGAGVIAIIKPHFIAAIVLTAATAAWSAKSWRVFFALENWIAGAMFAAYAVFVYLAFPVFVREILPLVAEIYVPIRSPLWRFLIHFGTPIYLAVLGLIWLLKGREVLRAPYSLLLAASIGFSFSYYSQLKGWAYHAYPMLAFALAAAAIAFAQPWPLMAPASEIGSARKKHLGAALAVAVLAGATFLWMNFALDMRALREPIARTVANPKVLAITSDIALGHPLTRAVNGIWVGRVSGQWIATGAKILKRESTDTSHYSRYDQLEAYDRNMLIEDIRDRKPDIILVERIRYDWYEWARHQPALARELENYSRLDEINDVLILRRK